MQQLLDRGQAIFGNGRNGNTRVYRGVLELMGRFGYVSLEEVIYGYELTFREAFDRLNYLEKSGLIQRFESFTLPRWFFCLTALGAQVVRTHGISDEIHPFSPAHYSGFTQRHSRILIQIYLALHKMLGTEMGGWLSERTLRAMEASKLSQDSALTLRVLDAMFQLRMQSEAKTEAGSWWCGLELELTLKSAQRYRKQFKDLSDSVYDSFDEKQIIPLMLFLCGTPAIQKKLMEIRAEHPELFGRCLFAFGLVDAFLKDLGNASLILCLGRNQKTILGSELRNVAAKVSPMKGGSPQGGASCL